MPTPFQGAHPEFHSFVTKAFLHKYWLLWHCLYRREQPPFLLGDPTNHTHSPWGQRVISHALPPVFGEGNQASPRLLPRLLFCSRTKPTAHMLTRRFWGTGSCFQPMFCIPGPRTTQGEAQQTELTISAGTVLGPVFWVPAKSTALLETSAGLEREAEDAWQTSTCCLDSRCIVQRSSSTVRKHRAEVSSA